MNEQLPLSVEALEDRMLLAATWNISGTTLTFVGTNNDDRVDIRLNTKTRVTFRVRRRKCAWWQI